MNEVTRTDIDVLIGATVASAEDGGATLRLVDGRTFYFWHDQSCCECVGIEEVTGDLNDLVGTPIMSAYETTQDVNDDLGTTLFTFYHFRTHKGDVCIRWRGESNGYYGVEVSYGFNK